MDRIQHLPVGALVPLVLLAGALIGASVEATRCGIDYLRRRRT